MLAASAAISSRLDSAIFFLLIGTFTKLVSLRMFVMGVMASAVGAAMPQAAAAKRAGCDPPGLTATAPSGVIVYTVPSMLPGLLST